MHLITAHIDELIAKVSAPLDRLVDIALQASRTTSMAKHHLLGKFEAKASFISDQLEVVCLVNNQTSIECIYSAQSDVQKWSFMVCFCAG